MARSSNELQRVYHGESALERLQADWKTSVCPAGRSRFCLGEHLIGSIRLRSLFTIPVRPIML
jgi:hypothetical protein